MPLVRIQLEGFDQLKAELADIRVNQLPFASALALTRTAQDAQENDRSNVLPLKFTLRRASWAKQGVRITAATKTNLQASVQDIHPYMALQETGGEKIAYKNMLAIPLEGARPTLQSLIADENRPHAVMARGGFIRDNVMYAVALKSSRRGRVSRAIAGISKSATWSRQVVPMYVLAPQAVIGRNPAKLYGFVAAAQEMVAQRFELNFRQAYLRAVRTAR